MSSLSFAESSRSTSGREAPRRPFSLAEARSIVRDLFEPDPWVYWTDFLLAIVPGHILFSLVRLIPEWMPEATWTRHGLVALCFVGASLLFYRAAMFIHELVHLPHDGFKGFRFAWNLLAGVPFLMPSFIYLTHIDHHRRKHFSTSADGEYLPLGLRGLGYLAYYFSLSFLMPLMFALRFSVFTPLCWISSSIRKFAYSRMSSMVMDPFYVRPMPTKDVLATIALQEWACCAVCWGAILVPLALGRNPLPLIVHGYATGCFILVLNSFRTAGAHRWWNDGRELSFVDQMLDSVTVADRPWISEIWGPIGTRYHGLHHLFPSMPYHRMPEAHARLMAQLPADSPYRETVEPSLTSALWNLAKRSFDAGRGNVHRPRLEALPEQGPARSQGNARQAA